MLSRILAKARRVYIRVRVSYLKYELNEARIDACVIQAEMIHAPKQLKVTQEHITALAQRIQRLEGTL